jgi:G:T/U-mismatch repair DNA glycosylase
MIEIHPFGDFVFKNTRYLLLGSFTTKPSDNYLWFYANGRNHFWPILQKVYKTDLSTKNPAKTFN